MKNQSTLRKKCPNTDLFLVRIFLYSVRIQENTDPEITPYLNIFHAVVVSGFKLRPFSILEKVPFLVRRSNFAAKYDGNVPFVL